MFMLSLGLEIYGTALGNWAWRHKVPMLGWTTMNPPLAAGTFYCMLDMLVVTTMAALQRRQNPAATRLTRLGGTRRPFRLGRRRLAVTRHG